MMEKKFVTLEGESFCYVDEGSGPPLVLLHGFLVSHKVWQHVWPALTAKFRVIAPDLLGHGDSARPPVDRVKYDADALADRAAAVIKHLGLSNVGLVGHSMGGRVAMHLTLRHPGLVGRLMLLDSVGVPQALPLLGRIVTAPVVGKPIFKHLYTKAVVRTYFKGDVFADPKGVTDAMVDEVYRCLELPNGRNAMYSVLENTVAPNGTMAGEDTLTQLKLPVKLLWGEKDKIFPVDNAHRFERLIAGSSLTVIPGIGHSPPEEAPARTSEVILEFFGAAA